MGRRAVHHRTAATPDRRRNIASALGLARRSRPQLVCGYGPGEWVKRRRSHRWSGRLSMDYLISREARRLQIMSMSWDDKWRDARTLERWLEPDATVARLAAELRTPRAQRALDLG